MGKDENELVVIEMVTVDRIRLSNQIYVRMKEMGYTPYDYKALELGFELGFELPCSWPANEHTQPTLAQLTVLSKKLKMRILINNLNLESIRDVPADRE